MKKQGIVKSVFGDNCEVVIRRDTACGENCASCAGACKMRYQTVLAKNSIGASVGENVIIETDDRAIYKAAFLVYILPLCLFLIAYGILGGICGTSKVTIGISIFIGLASLIPAFAYDRKKKNDLMPIVTEIIKST